MAKIDDIEGVWKAVAYEENGVKRSDAALQDMARLLILSGNRAPVSDGIWGMVRFFQPPTAETIEQSIESLRQLVEGKDYPRCDKFHIYTGGVVTVGNDDRSDSIDFLVYHGPTLHSQLGACSMNRGIYQSDAVTLTLCLADGQTNQRPTKYESIQTPNQSLAVYTHEHSVPT
jgi:hypothetical protein